MGFIEEHRDYLNRLEISLSKINDMELAKKRLTYIRWKVSENLDKLLFEFETNVKKNDAGIIWCPDQNAALEQLNKQLKPYGKVRFFKHNAVRYLVNALDIQVPEPAEQPEAVIIGAKFIMANTGNFYAALRSAEEYEMLINAKKIVVIAGIDSVLALQSELYTARQLYAIFETGDLHYPAEILGRPGRIRGLNAEISLLLTDLNKNRLLDIPTHRPLFSLLNFDLPPVCPMQQLQYNPEDWKYKDTLAYVLHAFINGMEANKSILEGNYGLKPLNGYLPYDIDLYEQILDARAHLRKDEKQSLLMRLMDADKSGLITQPSKFADPEKFRKFAEHNFFGKH